MESRKLLLMNPLAGKEWRCRRRERTCGHSGTNGESSTDIHALPRVQQMVGEKLLCNTGSPVWCSVMMREAARDKRREAPEGRDTCTVTADSCMAETNNVAKQVS